MNLSAQSWNPRFESRGHRRSWNYSNANPTAETLYKIYELVEGHPRKRKQFQAQFGVPKDEFDRFADAVHNPVVSGDLARHAYDYQPQTKNPMTIHEAEQFVVDLAKRWLASVRLNPSETK